MTVGAMNDIHTHLSGVIQVKKLTFFPVNLISTHSDLGCRTVATMIKGKSPEEIRKLFHIKNDFTPEEEAQIRRENEWAEE